MTSVAIDIALMSRTAQPAPRSTADIMTRYGLRWHSVMTHSHALAVQASVIPTTNTTFT